MELDSLKYIWKTLEPPAAPKDDERQILAMIQKKSEGSVAKMRRNLYKECVLILATYIPTIFLYFLAFDGRLSEIGWLFILILGLFAAYFYRKNRLLKEMQCVSCQVRSNLHRQVSTLKKYTRFYVLAGTLIVPLMAVLSYAIIRYKFPPAPATELLYKIGGTPWWQNPWYWAAALTPLTIGLYYMNRWYVRCLYGRHIRKLQDLLDEMDA